MQGFIRQSNCVDSQVTTHTDLEQAYHRADLIVLLDEQWCDGLAPEGEEELQKSRAHAMSERYREYGRLIDARAQKEVKVIVAGESFVNLRCSLLLDHARSINSRQFVAMATQLENEARAVVAGKLNVRPSGTAASFCVWWRVLKIDR